MYKNKNRLNGIYYPLLQEAGTCSPLILRASHVILRSLALHTAEQSGSMQGSKRYTSYMELLLNVLVIPGGVSLSENIYVPGMFLWSIILVPNGKKEGSGGTNIPIFEDTPVVAVVRCTST